METQRTFRIKNMVCSRCLKVINKELEELNISVLSLELGKLTAQGNGKPNLEVDKLINEVLYSNGFEVIKTDEEMLVEKVKLLLISLLTELPLYLKVKTSEYLASELHREYKTLSRVFSKYENITIEKYFIKLKIEKVKELIQLDQYTFSDIAYILGYSSVNHLSKQFKEIVGISMTDYKNSEGWERKFYDKII